MNTRVVPGTADYSSIARPETGPTRFTRNRTSLVNEKEPTKLAFDLQYFEELREVRQRSRRSHPKLLI